MSCLSYSYCQISRGSLHFLFTHVYKFQCIIISCSWLNLDLEFLWSTHQFPSSTSLTLSPNNFALPFASRALLAHHIVVSSSHMNFPYFFTLPLTLTASHNIILILCSRSQTMRAGHSLKDGRFDNFALIEILKGKNQRDFQISSFEFMEIDFILDIRIGHFFSTDPIIKVFTFFIWECLISWIIL